MHIPTAQRKEFRAIGKHRLNYCNFKSKADMPPE